MRHQLHRNIIFNLNDHIVDYPTPASINFFWVLSFLISFFRLNGNLLLDSIIKLRC